MGDEASNAITIRASSAVVVEDSGIREGQGALFKPHSGFWFATSAHTGGFDCGDKCPANLDINFSAELAQRSVNEVNFAKGRGLLNASRIFRSMLGLGGGLQHRSIAAQLCKWDGREI